MKRKTTKPRRHSRQSVLEVRVMSPRIAWFGFLKCAGKMTKFACVLAALAAIGWGVWRGIQHAFYKNPDFRLQMVDLNENQVIDELGVAAAAGIDLTANPNLFDIDVKDIGLKLKQQPAIADARAERHLPGTLVVRVVPRVPKAWIASPAAGLSEVRRAGAMLVDHDGIAYPCPDLQLDSAVSLPVITLNPVGADPIRPGEKIRSSELEHCFQLLDSARSADPDAMQWIESVKQINDWSLVLITRQGTSATFGIGDHERQIDSLRAALDHAGEKGYVIDTINLIPKYNIPITLRDQAAPPRAIPVSAAQPADERENRRTRDLSSLLNRN